ncbi:MAG: M48 family metalloprotease [Pseudomonadota bacterium]
MLSVVVSAPLRHLRRVLACVAVLALSASLLVSSPQFARAQIGLIRDAEIEGLLRFYAVPLFRVAGLNPGSVRVYLVNSNTLNAFVAGGQRIFVHTGLLTRARTPGELIGVLAHETAHIAGGHLATLDVALDRASTQAIIGMLLGAAAVVGGAAAGSGDLAQAGGGIAAGGGSVARRNLLTYVRAQESAADQAAARYLEKTKQSGKGMLTLFNRMADQSLASLRYQDLYARSHPFERARMRALETFVKKSPHYNKPPSKAVVLRHKLMQAKLHGFLQTRSVFRKYPKTDRSLPAHYARAIASFRSGDIKNALREIAVLTKAMPKNPYFWELKGQALLNAGQPAQAVPPLERAVRLAPGAGLIRILLAQSMLATGNKRIAGKALQQLHKARRSENRSAQLHLEFAKAYAMQGKIGMADLSTAEAALRAGDVKLAKLKAKHARKRLKRGTVPWRRTDDILNVRAGKKK